ncbi:S-layer protein [Saccharibacillus sp. O16]|nr:S-layer protein [Saccharibacillus sp. O16]
MKKKAVIALSLATLLGISNAPAIHALAPVAEVYYNTGTSTYDTSDFDSQLNDAIKAKLVAMGVDPKYVYIMDASADRSSITDTSHVHSGYESWYNFGSTPEVETPDYNHVQFSDNGNTLTFYGYTAPGYKDYMLTNGSPTGKKIITFDMDESKANYHSMEGGGFLFNTKIDANNKMSGYVILYVQEHINVYKLTGVDAEELYKGTGYSLDQMAMNNQGVELLQSYAKGSSTKHTIKIVSTDTTLNMWDNGEQIIRKLSLPTVYGDEFGPIVSYTSHGCEIISIFSFENMKLYSTSSKSLDVAVNKIPWGTAPLRYVVNIKDNPTEELDGGTKQAELKETFDRDEAQYLGVTDVTYKHTDDEFIDSIKKGGLHVDVDKAYPQGVEELATKIANELVNGYKESIKNIESAESNTNIQFADGDWKDSVNGDIQFVQDPSVTTTWSSDQPSVIGNDGKVTRPITSKKGTYVTLKATLTQEGKDGQRGLTSEKTFTVYVNAAQPAPLSTLTTTSGNGSATLKFPALTGATKITVEQSTDGGDTFTPVDLPQALDASSTSATVTGLNNGDLYYFRLNVEGGFYAGPSNPVLASPSEALTALEAESGNGKVTLKFPALTGAKDIVVEQSTDGENFTPVTLEKALDATSTGVTIEGLDNGGTYFYRLNIKSGKYAGVSNAVQVAPSEPVSTLEAEAGQGQVTLKFPALTGAKKIIIERSTDGVEFTAIPEGDTLTTDSTSITLPGLSPRENYRFRLRVEGGIHAGVSNTVEITPQVVIVPNVPDAAAPAPLPAPAPAASTPAPTQTPTVQQPATSMKTEVVVSDTANGGKAVQDKITKLVGENLNVSGKIVSADGKELNLASVQMNSDGTFALPQVPAGQYTLALNVMAPNGEKLAGPSGKLSVDSQGKAKMSVDLVDPYGTLTDSVTGKPVAGVNMKLYWADTELNRSKGRVAGTPVNLPELSEFAPNKNHNPQSSTDEGKYGWMVFPEGDYYFLGEKEGYNTFDSRKQTQEETFGSDSYIKNGIIHVGQTLVKFDVTMQPKVKEAGDHVAYMKGYPNGTFQTDRGISRAEVAAILSRLYADEATGKKATYKDVAAKNWALDAIQTAGGSKWMVGFADGTFKPKKEVTRAEFAQTLANLYGWDTAGDSTFTDVSGHWSKEAVAAMQQQGLLFDFTGDKFNPNQAITRLEVVRIMNHLLGRHPWEINVSPKWSDVPQTHPSYSDIMEASVPHGFEQLETGIENWK